MILGGGGNPIRMIFTIANQSSPIPNFIVLAMCWIFVILFGVWLQPHTVFIRHSCLIIGAVIGLYVILLRYRCLLQSNALPLLLLILLLGWVSLHLFFLGQNFELQLHEYSRAWKKIALTIPFGIGLGLCLNDKMSNQAANRIYWRIIYLGFLAPTLVYFVKFLSTIFLAPIFQEMPKFLYLSSDHMGDLWGVSRAAYIFFCLPAFAISMAMLIQFFEQSSEKRGWDWIYLFGLILPPLIPFIENDRTGVLYCILFSLLTILLVVKRLWESISLKRVLLVLSLFTLVIAISWVGIQRNDQWKTLASDAKLAIQIDKYNNWQHLKNQQPTPFLNEMGIQVSESNYDRIAWVIQGFRQVIKHPFGYGLMTLSFGHLNAIDYPNSQTNQSHSAWLDFTLGYGLPGLLLLFGAAVLTWWNGKSMILPWRILPLWVLGYWIMLFLQRSYQWKSL